MQGKGRRLSKLAFPGNCVNIKKQNMSSETIDKALQTQIENIENEQVKN